MLKIDDFSKKMPNLDIFVKKRLIRVSLLKSKDECRKNISADHVTRGSFTGSVTTKSIHHHDAAAAASASKCGE